MSRYEDEAQRLAALPRAERFEQLLSFPTDHTFTVIGRRDGLADSLQRALAGAGHQEACLVERASAKGTYLSLSFTVRVQSGNELDALYLLLEALPGLAYLL
jgi:putative lipoic acid-binding regulatory protein